MNLIAKRKSKRLKLVSIIKQSIWTVVLVLVLSFAADLWRTKDMPELDLSSLVLNDLNGSSINLESKSLDQPLMIYVWATWCAVCNYVSPSVDIMAKHFEVVSIAISSGDNAKLNAYLEHNDYRFSTVNDQQSQLATLWGINYTPTIMVIKDGEVKHLTVGFTALPGMWWRMLFY